MAEEPKPIAQRSSSVHDELSRLNLMEWAERLYKDLGAKGFSAVMDIPLQSVCSSMHNWRIGRTKIGVRVGSKIIKAARAFYPKDIAVPAMSDYTLLGLLTDKETRNRIEELLDFIDENKRRDNGTGIVSRTNKRWYLRKREIGGTKLVSQVLYNRDGRPCSNRKEAWDAAAILEARTLEEASEQTSLRTLEKEQTIIEGLVKIGVIKNENQE